MDSIRFLFVYGTLRQGTGHPMSTFLATHAHSRGPAKTRGRLYDLGSYPGMLPAREESEWVHGDLFELIDPSSVLQELDRYEGCSEEDPQPWFIQRETATVLTRDEQELTCWVYFYQRPISEKRLIESGDYYRTDLRDFDWRQTL